MSPARALNAAPALELVGIFKRFGDVAALDDARLSVAQGSVHALLGENGAGKTTLMRIAYGLVRPDAGAVRLFGAPSRFHSVQEARRAGVGMVHQHLSLAPNLSATENFALGGRGAFRPHAAATRLRMLAQSAGLRVDADTVVRDLGIVEQQRLEILKALAGGARLLILDEPTSGLAPSDIDELLGWIRRFADSGGSVVLVTHKLREAMAVADDITVLRRGRVVNAGQAHGRTERDLAIDIFPEAPPRTATGRSSTPGEPVVVADGLHVADARGVARIVNAAFRIHRGEVVGVAAIEGSGHRQLMEALSALRHVSAGTLRLPSRIAVIPADRTREGLIPELSLTENVALLGAGTRRGRMAWSALAQRTRALLERFEVVAHSPAQRADTLSGGNQQRLVVARELEEPVDLVVADNPTRGLDLRASAFVHEQLHAAASSGAGVVVHSSDLDELLSLATRVLVVFHGTVSGAPVDRDAVGRAMLGVAL